MKKIYINGEFITLEDDEIEAILIEDDKIKKAGKKEEILKLKDETTEIIDLCSKTMMPAFIDPHSHFFAVANSLLQVSLEDCKNIKEIQDKLLKYKNENNIKRVTLYMKRMICDFMYRYIDMDKEELVRQRYNRFRKM